MAIEKKVINTGKKILVGALITGALAFGGCRGDREENPPVVPNPPTNPFPTPYPDPSPVPIPDDPDPTSNDAPQTTIIRDFGTGLSGEVDYTFCGADPDQGDYINYINTNVNGFFWKYISPGKYNPYCVTASFPIVDGTNSAQATASDSNGMDDLVGATDSFYSPTEEEAREKIDELLVAEGFSYDVTCPATPHTYCNDSPFLVIGQGMINTDFLLRRGDNSTAFIEYIGHGDDETIELSEKQKLDGGLLPNLYMNKLPLDEVTSFFDNFANVHLY